MSDDVMQDLDRLMRVGLTTAAQLGEHLRRRAAEADRWQRDAAIAEQHAAVERVRAIREEARAHYAKIGWADWQDQATLAAWAEAYQVTHQMRPFDPVAAAAHDRIETEVRRRFNVDIREALQLHLQQIAEDQRIRAEHDRDTTVQPPAAQTRTSGQATGASVEPEPAKPDVPESVDLSPGDPNTIPGEVVTEAEVQQAETAAKTAAEGFDQPADVAVRQHRGSRLGRTRSRPARTPDRGLTASRRRGR